MFYSKTGSTFLYFEFQWSRTASSTRSRHVSAIVWNLLQSSREVAFWKLQTIPNGQQTESDLRTASEVRFGNFEPVISENAVLWEVLFEWASTPRFDSLHDKVGFRPGMRVTSRPSTPSF